jgi:hypothetical protein
MKTRAQLSQLDDSMFTVIENRKLAVSIGGGSSGDTATVHATKKWFGKAKVTSVSSDGTDTYAGE